MINKNKLQCTVTGIFVSVAPKVYDKRTAVYGSPDLLKANYISALGRKLLVQGLSLDEIRAQYNVSEDVPKPSVDFITKYTRWAKYRKPKVSAPPDISNE